MLAEAHSIAGTATTQATVEFALADIVGRARRRSVVELRGAGWDGDLDESRLGRNT